MDAQERTKEDLQAELRGAWLQIESLEKRLQIAQDNCAAALDERNAAFDKLHRIEALVKRAQGLGIASVEGPGLHDFRGDIQRGQKPDNLDAIRKMASAGEPLIDVEGRDVIRKSTSALSASAPLCWRRLRSCAWRHSCRSVCRSLSFRRRWI